MHATKNATVTTTVALKVPINILVIPEVHSFDNPYTHNFI